MLNGLFRSPALILVAFACATVFFGWQARHFEINASADTLIGDDNRLYLKSQKISQRFSPEEFLLVVYEPRDRALFSETSLTDIARLSQSLAELDRVESVRSILNVPLLSKGKVLSGDIDPDGLTQKALKLPADELAETFKDHPIYEGLIINPEQSATALQVLFKPNEKLKRLSVEVTDLRLAALDDELNSSQKARLERLQEEQKQLQDQLRQQQNREVEAIIKRTQAYEDRATIYLGGLQTLGYELISIIKSDLLIFGGIIALVICAVLLALFRSVRWVIIPVLCCLASVSITLGLFGMLGLAATVISSSFVALQLILTLAIVIHLIVQYRETARENPDGSQQDWVMQSLKRKIAPCFYAALTTSIGFGSLLFSGIQPVISFGWMMVVAMLVSTACSLLLFPALNLILPKQTTPERNSLFHRLISLCQQVASGRSGLLYLGCLLLAAVAVVGLLKLEVENSFINYFDRDTRIYRELRFVDQHFGGSTPLDVIYRIPQAQQHPELDFSAESIQTLQKMQAMLEDHDAVGTTLSAVNVTELARQINDDRPLTEYELTALYRSLDTEIRKDLVGSFYSPDTGELRISTRIKDSTEGLNRKQLLADIRSDLAELGIDESNVELSNLFVLYQDMLERLFSSQILTLGIVFGVLFLMFCLLFHSPSIALVALAPNALSALIVLGSMGWFRVPLDFMTITIAAIAIGIAVDDTIHYVHRYREEITGDDPLGRSHHGVGYALLYTSLIVICGFSLLAFSNFTPSRMFGLFTGLAMAVAMLSNLTLLPALLEGLRLRRHFEDR